MTTASRVPTSARRAKLTRFSLSAIPSTQAIERLRAKHPKTSPLAASRWPNRLAWVLACATFPLVSVGGLVTSYQAGMAVPDWPTTFNYWFYPLHRWLWKWGDLFLEHGHRTLAQIVGLLAIALAVTLWTKDGRKWMRWLAVALVAGVLLQGTLGGLRVLWRQPWLAELHGCVAPLYFGLCTAIVTLTSASWRRAKGPEPHAAARRLHRLSLILAAGIYLLIVLGTQLRHPLRPGDVATYAAWGPIRFLSAGLITTWFDLWVGLKLMVAGLMVPLTLWLLVHVRRHLRPRPAIVRRAELFAGLFLLQLVLAAATWVTNYNWPRWFTNYVWAFEYTVVEEGPLEVLVTTAHAATGSLNFVAALCLTLWSRRLLRRPLARPGPSW